MGFRERTSEGERRWRGRAAPSGTVSALVEVAGMRAALVGVALRLAMLAGANRE